MDEMRHRQPFLKKSGLQEIPLLSYALQAAAAAPLGSISLSVVSADMSSGAPAHSLPYWPSLSPERQS